MLIAVLKALWMIGAIVGDRAVRRVGLMLKMSEALSGLRFFRSLVIVSRLVCRSWNGGGGLG